MRRALDPNAAVANRPAAAPRYRAVKKVIVIAGALVGLLPALFACDSRAATPQERVAAAAKHARRSGTPSAFADALLLALQNDEWATARQLAEDADRRFDYPEPHLTGLIALAYWRGGRLPDAERVAARLHDDVEDEYALDALLRIRFGRGDFEQARVIAGRVERQGPLSGPGAMALICTRMSQPTIDVRALVAGLRRARAGHRNSDPGQSEPPFESQAALFESAGGAGVNHVVTAGSAPMPVNATLHIPTCEVWLNGKGPFQFLIDTGAGNMAFLSPATAEDIGLATAGRAPGYGFGGTVQMASGVIDRMTIGAIEIHRVIAQVPSEAAPILQAVDGLLGTGIFADARVQLDFAQARLCVLPSSDEPATGVACDIRIAGNMHVVAPVRLIGADALAMLDTGATYPLISLAWLHTAYPKRTFHDSPLPLIGLGTQAIGPQPASAGELVLVGRHFPQFAGMGAGDLDRTFSPGLGVQLDLVLGMTVFREMKSWTVDYPQRRMWIDWLDD
jgi:hypothetical protein